MSVGMMINILHIMLSLAMEAIKALMGVVLLGEVQVVSKGCMVSLIKDIHRAPTISILLPPPTLEVLDSIPLRVAMVDLHLLV